MSDPSPSPSPLSSERLSTSIGLLALRASVAAMMMTHGYAKIMRFEMLKDGFADPLGVGPTLSVSMAIFGEFFCTLLIIFGVFTRLSAVPWIITMLVITLIVDAGQPFGERELAFVYLAVASSIAILGPGRFSLDAWLASKKKWARWLVL